MNDSFRTHIVVALALGIALHAAAEQAQWPETTLSAVVGRGSRGAATINGEVVPVGATYSNMTVIGIGSNGACLRLGREIGFKKIGSHDFVKYTLSDEILDAMAPTNSTRLPSYSERLQRRRQELLKHPTPESE